MSQKAATELDMPGGKKYPMVGYGTFTHWNATGSQDEVKKAVEIAIDVGYRHFDCAYLYENEESVGKGIRAKIADGTITREDVWITTKLWDNFHNPKDVKRALNMSLKNLGMDYVDLYLVHWPIDYQDGDNMFPKDENGKPIFAYHDKIELWKAMEELVDLGLSKNIGLSNFNKRQIERILANCRIKPANNQVEIHPYFCNKKLVEFCQQNGITVTAYAPFGNPSRSWKKDTDPPSDLEDPVIQAIAKSKGKSAAQVVLRWLIQRGIVVIPKSVTPSRIKDNISVFDFELSQEEMQKIFAVDKNHRNFPEPSGVDHPDYPFHDEY